MSGLSNALESGIIWDYKGHHQIRMKIFLTGCAGQLARVVLPRLCAHPDVERVIGVDPRPTDFTHAKFSTCRLDYADPAAWVLLGQCDALAHLGFHVLRGKMDADAMWQNNVAGAKLLFEAAVRAGVRRVLHVSSAAVYGGGERLREDAPLRPLPGFLYAGHKAELETWLQNHLPLAVRLRPHAILGANAQPLLKFLLRQPFYPSLPFPQPLLQCVHEEDVATAIVLSLFGDAVGPFNLAAPDCFSFRQAIRARHAVSLSLPFGVARVLMDGLWRATGWGGEPGWLAGMRQPLTLDCGRAERELGWRPAYPAVLARAAAIARQRWK